MPTDAPLPYDLMFSAGQSVRHTFGITEGGVAVDMTGWASAAVVRATADRLGATVASTATMNFTCTYDPVLKAWTLALDPSDSESVMPSVGLPFGFLYFWDWKLTRPDGVVLVPYAGLVTLLRKAT